MVDISFSLVFVTLQLTLLECTDPSQFFAPLMPTNRTVFTEWKLWKSTFGKRYSLQEDSTRFQSWLSNFHQVLIFNYESEDFTLVNKIWRGRSSSDERPFLLFP